MSGENSPSEWDVKSPRCVIRCAGGRQVRRPSDKRTLQPRDIENRKDGLAEPLTSRRRQQTARETRDRSRAGRPRGMEEGMRRQLDAEQERPVPAADMSGKGVAYKPTAKGPRAGRESEGFIVPTTPVSKGRSREGTLLWLWPRREVSVRAWSQDPTTPPATVTAKVKARRGEPFATTRELPLGLYTVATRLQLRRRCVQRISRRDVRRMRKDRCQLGGVHAPCEDHR